MRGAFSLVWIVLILLASCAPYQVKGPADDLEKTVRAYYELRKKGDIPEAWKYERRSLIENKQVLEEYRRAYFEKEPSFIVKDYQILEIGKEGSGAKGLTPVRIKIVSVWPVLPFKAPPGNRIIEMEDFWDKISGKWYHVKAGINDEFF